MKKSNLYCIIFVTDGILELKDFKKNLACLRNNVVLDIIQCNIEFSEQNTDAPQ